MRTFRRYGPKAILFALVLSSCATGTPIQRELQRQIGRGDASRWMLEQMRREVVEMEDAGMTREQIRRTWAEHGRRYLETIYALPDSCRFKLLRHLRENLDVDIREMKCKCTQQ